MNSRSTGDLNIIIWTHLKELKIYTSVQDLEHVDNEIDLADLKGCEGMSRQPQASKDRLVFPVGHGGPCWFSSVHRCQIECTFKGDFRYCAVWFSRECCRRRH